MRIIYLLGVAWVLFSSAASASLCCAISGESFREPEMVAIPGKNYEMGKYEVTQWQWRTVMGNNPSYFQNCGDACPVEQVSWNDVQEFIRKLNTKTSKQYRLPTRAEWEYACYGGG